MFAKQLNAQRPMPYTISSLSLIPEDFSIIDGFVKSLKSPFDVIPAKAGIQYFKIVLDACLRRHDGVSDILRVCYYWVFALKDFTRHGG